MKRLSMIFFALFSSFLSLTLQPVRAQITCEPDAVISLVSIDLDDQPSGGFVFDEQSVSGDGRYVVFAGGGSKISVRDRETCQTIPVSVSSTGEPSNDDLFSVQSLAVISENGRYVTFMSNATNLVPDDMNTCPGATEPGRCLDIFVRDIQASQTLRVSVASDGSQSNSGSAGPSISATGRYIAFSSSASNLVNGDTNGKSDIFVHDRDADNDGIFDEPGAISTTRVSVSSSGTQGNDTSGEPYISPDGRYVAFDSYASSLVGGDTNKCDIYTSVGQCPDIFIHDRQTHQTRRISRGIGGAQANGISMLPSLSADGNMVLFYSEASNLVSGDNNGQMDVFIVNRKTGQTSRIPNFLGRATLSGDGRYVAFNSYTPNLTPDDLNTCQNYESPPGACPDIFVQDLATGEIALISVAADGTQADSDSVQAFFSADGRYIAFTSTADNLIPGVISDGHMVYIARNPLAPPGTPQRNTFETNTPTLTWNRISWATGYHVQVAWDANFGDIVFEGDNLPIDSLALTVDPPLDEGRYYWRIKALNGSTWSKTEAFTVDTP